MTAEDRPGLPQRESTIPEFKDILRQNLPCWYELSWRKGKPAIILRIHNDFIRNTKTIPPEAPIIRALAGEFGFTNFSSDFGKDIGFDQAFKYRGQKQGFTEYVVEIPTVKRDTGAICDDCEGSGKDDYSDRKCFSCGGTGREYTFDWYRAYVVSASFTIFTRLLSHCEKDTSAPYSQLMTVETIARKNMYGGSLSGEISIPLCQWLSSSEGDKAIPEVIEAMKTAYRQMLGLQTYDMYQFKVHIGENGRIIIDCPGEACGIHPADWYMREGQGYEFSCHNVDSPAQQLTLLVGLAVLHDKARKEIKT